MAMTSVILKIIGTANNLEFLFRFFGSSTVCDNDNDKNFVRKQNVKISRKSLHGFTNDF